MSVSSSNPSSSPSSNSSSTSSSNPFWPLFDLGVRTPRLELRYLDDELGVEMVEVARRGIHDPSWMPFGVPWTDADDLEAQAFRFYWTTRGSTSPTRWNLLFAVVVDGAVVGACDLAATDFPTLRVVTTGSWLGRDHQGRGLGTELRHAALHLAFAGFGALEARTSAFDDNGPSLGVTAKLGYEPDGGERYERRPGEVAEMRRFRMRRDHWETIRRDDIVIEGLAAARAFLEIPDPER